MKRIKATFIGQDGSLGYEQGKEYELLIEALHSLSGRSSTIAIIRVDLQGACPYRNIETFLDNWTKIESMHDD